MNVSRPFVSTVLGALCLVPFHASAQAYPTKPVRMITASAGGGVDFAARFIAQGLGASLGQPVVVENRGGNAAIAADVIVKSPPDGHNLLFYGPAIWLLPFMRDDVPYDPVADLAPISLTNSSPNAVAITASLPIQSVKELLAYARARPGQLNYASIGPGTTSHLAAEYFKALANVYIVHIPYTGNGPALAALASGEVHLMFGTVASVLPLVKAGKLRMLAVTSARPSALAPGVPTVAATGLPGYQSLSTNAMFAPGKTPPAIIGRLHQETVRILALPDTREKFLNAGLEIVASTPEQLRTAVRDDMAQLGKVIKERGIRAE